MCRKIQTSPCAYRELPATRRTHEPGHVREPRPSRRKSQFNNSLTHTIPKAYGNTECE
ncbi:hypothetical protein BDP81DRAFT_418769 [Colletotrichum phormii]|uniref:Uncharacterized protein n=1 Tax=Colletotrichum phormii TaxID=359342 RepID=A0AAJ0A3F0_9PEZI|nr:uncharacterized protein BDP81DRAFT_418769 [Colletotrichum phormii]KAK1641372.1 hypothetical protein BDP81DRAFT_418769 [Colletotrichum phormii]